jgi:putative membrane protein
VLHTDAKFSQAVEAAVSRIEQQTDAEVIVVAASRSGSYRDVSLVGASLLSMAALIVLIVVPVVVHPTMVIIEVALTWAIASWVLDGAWFVRLLTPRRRREAQVDESAHAEFHRESVHATPHRTGVLVYVSALEGKVEVLADLGIQGRVPPARWQTACANFAHDDLPHFLRGLDALGEVLAQHVPKVEDDVIDLPNAPRIRP